MSKQNVGKSVTWPVRRLDGGTNEVSGRVLAFVPAGERLRPAVPRGEPGTVAKGIADVSSVDRYVVGVPQPEGGRRGRQRLYAPKSAAVDRALSAAEKGVQG